MKTNAFFLIQVRPGDEWEDGPFPPKKTVMEAERVLKEWLAKYPSPNMPYRLLCRTETVVYEGPA